MSTGTGDAYHDSQVRHLTDHELLRGLKAIQWQETAWFMDPVRVEDLKRLHLVRMQVRTGRVQLGATCRVWGGSAIGSARRNKKRRPTLQSRAPRELSHGA